MTHGPQILVASLAAASITDLFGNRWQYHPRSDRHSKVACWAIALDLVEQSPVLRRHVEERKVVLGINHEMLDFATGRSKRLDLVFGRPVGPPPPGGLSFSALADRFGVSLSEEQRALLARIPDWPVAPVGSVLVALEAKAVMTAHIKALPRLYDELNSSHLCVHGASRQALSVGFAIVNAADRFRSPDRNRRPLGAGEGEISHDPQPRSLERTLAKLGELPRRSNIRETGFDALGVVVVEGSNTGTPFTLVTGPPAPQPGEPMHYDGMVARVAHEYDTTFASL